VEAKLAEGDEPPRVIAAWSDYNGLITALRNRAAELNLSGQEIDNVSNLPDRYSQKLLGPNAVRRLGALSLGPFLGALCLTGQFVENKAALERLRRQTTPRRDEYVRADATHVTLTFRFMQKIGRLGAKARVATTTKAQRQEWARKAATARMAELTPKQRTALMRALVLKRWRGP
jgi:hypothetical protein